MSYVARARFRCIALLLLAGCSQAGPRAPVTTGDAAPPSPAVDAAPAPPPVGGSGGSIGAAPPIDAAPPATDLAAPSPGGSPTGQTVTVSAGASDRDRSIASFPWDAAQAGTVLWLVGGDGARLPAQVDAQGRATFIVPSLKAGAQATFTVEAGAAPPATARAIKDGDVVGLSLGTPTPAINYLTKGKLPAGIGMNFLRGGYIHPLYTPSGVLVTDDYPGDHRHHHGIWSAWAHSTFEGRSMDFWNMGGGSAKVDFDSLESTWDGPVHTGLRTHHVFVDLKAPGGGKVAIKEQWFVTLYRTHEGAPPYYVFDIDSTQEAASASPVMLEQYLYGGFAFRGSAQWQAGATFLTSEGKDRGSGDGSTGKWCFIGGKVGGKSAGYAVLGHPTNFRAPQPMRLNPTDPYFSFSPVKPGGFPLMQGKPYLTRFRIVVVDGDPDKALFDRLWTDYATPPEVTLGKAP
jgi:hypothetical protein